MRVLAVRRSPELEGSLTRVDVLSEREWRSPLRRLGSPIPIFHLKGEEG